MPASTVSILAVVSMLLAAKAAWSSRSSSSSTSNDVSGVLPCCCCCSTAVVAVVLVDGMTWLLLLLLLLLLLSSVMGRLKCCCLFGLCGAKEKDGKEDLDGMVGSLLDIDFFSFLCVCVTRMWMDSTAMQIRCFFSRMRTFCVCGPD